MIGHKNNRKKIKLASIIIALLAILALVVVILELTHTIDLVHKPIKNNSADNGSLPLTNIVDYGPPKQEDTVISPEKNNATTEKMDTSTKEKISVVITRANRSLVSVYIEKLNGGTCNLSVIQSGVEKIRITAGVISEINDSTCEGFSIDSSLLDNNPYTINITVNSEGRTGTASKEVQ